MLILHIGLCLAIVAGYFIGHKNGYKSGYYDGYWAESEVDDDRESETSN